MCAVGTAGVRPSRVSLSGPVFDICIVGNERRLLSSLKSSLCCPVVLHTQWGSLSPLSVPHLGRRDRSRVHLRWSARSSGTLPSGRAPHGQAAGTRRLSTGDAPPG